MPCSLSRSILIRNRLRYINDLPFMDVLIRLQFIAEKDRLNRNIISLSQVIKRFPLLNNANLHPYQFFFLFPSE